MQELEGERSRLPVHDQLLPFPNREADKLTTIFRTKTPLVLEKQSSAMTGRRLKAVPSRGRIRGAEPQRKPCFATTQRTHVSEALAAANTECI